MKRKRKNPTDKAKQLAEQIVGQPVIYFNEGTTAELYNFLSKDKSYLIKITKSKIPTYGVSKLEKLSQHKLIPKIYEIGENHIIMDYLECLPLIKYCINKHKLSELEKYQLLTNIEKELDKWHELDIYHGDLQLENILVFNNLDTILIDPLYLNNIEYKMRDRQDLKYIKKDFE